MLLLSTVQEVPIEVEKIVEKIVYRDREEDTEHEPEMQIDFNAKKTQRSARRSQRSAPPPPAPAAADVTPEEEHTTPVVKNQSRARAQRNAPIPPLPPPPAVKATNEVMGDATINKDDEVLYTTTSYETKTGVISPASACYKRVLVFAVACFADTRIPGTVLESVHQQESGQMIISEEEIHAVR